ncbi:MAG: hypothetical protein M1818_002229 [Claussenomyces sp. TS43310]|nr:MAG: hypothetical protein M1818_002229 [Claussenomyces sp. TS43310]
MEAQYAQQPPPPLPHQSYTLPPGTPSETNYRPHHPSAPNFHGAAVPTHGPSTQSYNYNSNPTVLSNMSQARDPLPPPLQLAENGGRQSASLAAGTISGPSTAAEPAPHSGTDLGRRYALEVVQQPKRARMCGFGDKDRRPITPPPCIRLVITDAASGTEIDVSDIEHGLFVLNVDLWSADGLREVNLVRHSTTPPTVSSSLPPSYAANQEMGAPIYTSPLPATASHANAAREPQYAYHYAQQPPSSAGQTTSPPYNTYPQQQSNAPYAAQQQPPQAVSQGHYSHHPHQQQSQSGYPPRPSSPIYNTQRYSDAPNPYYHGANPPPYPGRPGELPYQGPDANMHRLAAMTGSPQATGMYTRNLIGSLAASAFRLTDPNDKIGIWFVLQDLSVRTEGTFRLRFSFVNVGAPSKTPNGNPANQVHIVNTGKAPILASCFSDMFTVYSAKKFPGVVESTPLSKCFATQGIKIPIRKDGPSKTNREEYDED